MSKAKILNYLSENFDDFYNRLKSSATENVLDQSVDESILDAWLIDTKNGGFLVREVEEGCGEKTICIEKFFNEPDQEFLNKKIDDNFDVYAEGVLDCSDDLYDFGSRPSREHLIHGKRTYYFMKLVLSAKNGASNAIREFFQDVNPREMGDKLDDELRAILEKHGEPKDDEYIIVDTFSHVAIDKAKLEELFKSIDFDPKSLFQDMEVDYLDKLEYTKIYGKQISRILKEKGFDKDNQFIFNDLDNRAYYCGQKEGFEVYAITCQNTKIMVFQKDDEFIGAPFEREVDFNELGIKTVEDFIKRGISSGSYMSTTKASPNFLPTFDYLMDAAIDDIRALESLCIHAKSDQLLRISDYFDALEGNIIYTQLNLAEEVGEELDKRFPYDGSFSQLADTMWGNHGWNAKSVRQFVLWTIGNGYEWHKDGYLYDPMQEMKPSPDNSAPEGEKYGWPYPASKGYSPIMSIPNNVRKDWLEQIKMSVEDAKMYCELNPEDLEARVTVEKVDEYVRNFESKRSKKLRR